MQNNIKFPQPYLIPFPSTEEVFVEPVAQYARHLHPLVSIDLSIINPDWSGKIHMISPIEPMEGCIGEASDDYYNDYLQHNWIGFKLNSDNKYELLGDFKYFLEERPDGPEPYKGAHEDIVEFYEGENENFQSAKEKFQQDVSSITALNQIGGGVPAHSLSYGEGIKLDESDPENVVPLTPDGRRFTFIASTANYNYGREGGVIHLFFEPQEKVCLFTFDYD